MVLLDTDILTHFHHGHQAILHRLQGCTDGLVGTTAVSKAQIMRGRLEFFLKADGHQLLAAQSMLVRSEELLSKMRIVYLDPQSIAVFSQLQSLKGLKKIGRADLLIASIALAHKAILVTRNVRDFQKVPHLQIENWMDS